MQTAQHDQGQEQLKALRDELRNWDGESVADLVAIIRRGQNLDTYVSELELAQHIDNHNVPDTHRGEFTNGPDYYDPTNSEAYMQSYIQILAVDKRGEALAYLLDLDGYTGRENGRMQILDTAEAFAIVDDCHRDMLPQEPPEMIHPPRPKRGGPSL